MSELMNCLGRQWAVPTIDPYALSTISPVLFAACFFATSPRNREQKLPPGSLKSLLTQCLVRLLDRHCKGGTGAVSINCKRVLKDWKSNESWNRTYQLQPKKFTSSFIVTSKDTRK